MPNMGDLDGLISNAIKHFVRISDHELYTHFWIVRLITTVWMLAEQSHGVADTCQYPTRPDG